MGTPRTGPSTARDQAHRNEVRLVGRVTQEPTTRELPSGDVVVGSRIAVERPPDGRRQRVDALECAAWGGRVRRSVSRWQVGDLVEVEGAVRRRFFRAAAGTGSRVEIEVSGARVIRRAASA